MSEANPIYISVLMNSLLRDARGGAAADRESTLLYGSCHSDFWSQIWSPSPYLREASATADTGIEKISSAVSKGAALRLVGSRESHRGRQHNPVVYTKSLSEHSFPIKPDGSEDNHKSCAGTNKAEDNAAATFRIYKVWCRPRRNLLGRRGGHVGNLRICANQGIRREEVDRATIAYIEGATNRKSYVKGSTWTGRV